MSLNDLQKKISAELVQFADCLVPSEIFRSHGRSLVQKVFEELKRDLRLRGIYVSHTWIGGSIGKNTSVIFPDFDCVIFLNNQKPPLKPLVEIIKEILGLKSDKLQIDVGCLDTSDSTIKIKFKTGIEMDLLPGCNYHQHDSVAQYEEVLRRIKMGEIEAWHYSSSLAPMQLEFTRKESGKTHQLIRIAKYWYKSGYFWMYGGSLMIEILCFCTELDLGENVTMLQGFKHLLSQYICKLDSLRIAFYRQETGNWIRVPEHNLYSYEEHFDSEILSRRNFIIEPANPYNDLAVHFKDNLTDMKQYGLEMLKRLDGGNNAIVRTPEGVAFLYEKLFQPFKLILRDFYSYSAIPSYVHVEYNYTEDYSGYGTDDVTVHNEDFFTKRNKEAKWVYENVLTNLLFLIRGKAVRSGIKPLTFRDGLPELEDFDEVESAVNIFTNANFGIGKFVKVTGHDHEHESSCVTLKIPYVIVGDRRKYAVRYSLTWASEQSSCAAF